VSLVSSASGGYRLHSSTEAREIKKFIKTFAMKFWTTIPTSIPFPFFVEPLDAIEIDAWPAKAQSPRYSNCCDEKPPL
jgi:hypothetical protein